MHKLLISCSLIAILSTPAQAVVDRDDAEDVRTLNAVTHLDVQVAHEKFSYLDENHHSIAEAHLDCRGAKLTENPLYFSLSHRDQVNFELEQRSILVITGRELLTQKEELSSFIEDHPNMTLLLDVARGDGLVDDGGRFVLWREHLPDVTSLSLSNKDGSVTTIGNIFLARRYGLTQLNFSSFENVTEIEEGFLEECSGLVHLDLSSLNNVSVIGDFFLSQCSSLTHLDLSPFRNVSKIGLSFLNYCSSLTQLDLFPLSNVTATTNNFMKYCDNLTQINLPENPPKILVYFIVKTLRESFYPHQQELGQAFYQEYLLRMPKDAQRVLSLYRLENLRKYTPKALEDIPDLAAEAVVSGFKSVFECTQEKLDVSIRAKYEQRLLPILHYLFIDSSVPVTWGMYEENQDELRIALKHMLKKFQALMAANNVNEVASYMMVFLKGFEECQSRQAGDINQITAALGITSGAIEGDVHVHVWGLINDFKLSAFQDFVKEKTGAHEYMRAFTVVNNAIGLPVAMRNFQERISPMSDDEMIANLVNFIQTYFTPELMVSSVKESLNASSFPYDVALVRSKIDQLEEEGKVGNAFEYFKNLAGPEAGEDFDPMDSPLTTGEVHHLLKLMRVFQ